jgi:hypothetical protein
VPQRLQDWDEGQGHRFDAVVALDVLHLFPSEEQARLLRQLAVRVPPGGTLLLGGYSEDPDPDEFALLLSVAQERLKRLGCDAATVERLLASRGTAVVGMRGPQLTQELTAAGLEPPPDPVAGPGDTPVAQPPTGLNRRRSQACRRRSSSNTRLSCWK